VYTGLDIPAPRTAAEAAACGAFPLPNAASTSTQLFNKSRSHAREHTLQALALAAAWPRKVPEAAELRTTSTKATRAAKTKLDAGGRRLPLDPRLRIGRGKTTNEKWEIPAWSVGRSS
jgi:hypothetical protein